MESSFGSFMFSSVREYSPSIARAPRGVAIKLMSITKERSKPGMYFFFPGGLVSFRRNAAHAAFTDLF
jgi:hypothetical protein